MVRLLRRVVITDHGAFVLVNVYVPNAGERPARSRLDFKVRFLRALKDKCDALAAAGREVGGAGGSGHGRHSYAVEGFFLVGWRGAASCGAGQGGLSVVCAWGGWGGVPSSKGE
jgi:hypothetical protein